MFSIDMLSGNLLLLLAILVFVAVLSHKLGAKVGVPSMLVFLLIGMLFGEEGVGLHFNNLHIAEFLCHLAMAIILITGGLHTDIKESRPVLRQGALLSTVGVLLTIGITGCFIYFVFGGGVMGVQMSIIGALLLAAVLSSTDSTTVFSILHTRRLHLRENLGPLLELESGSNDPMAYIITIILTKLLTATPESLQGVPSWGVALTVFLILLYQVVAGYFLGKLFGFLGSKMLEKVKLDSAPMVSILILSIAFLTDGITSLLGGSGLLALYVCTIRLGNSGTLPYKREILKFFDGISWLGQLLMVLILGLLAKPSGMKDVLLPSLGIGLFMMLVARPASVFLTLLPYRKMPAKAKLLVSWVGIKGAGPILFGLYTVLHGVNNSSIFFNVVLVITILSLLLQGMTLPRVAHWLGMAMDEDPVVESFGLELPEEMGMLRDHIVGPGEVEAGKTLRDMRLPHGIRVIMVKRGDRFLVPHGSMVVEEGDHLLIVMGETDDD